MSLPKSPTKLGTLGSPDGKNFLGRSFFTARISISYKYVFYIDMTLRLTYTYKE